MITLQNHLEINRPVVDVFDFIVNVENAPKWQPAVIETRRLTAGPLRVGSQFREVAKMMGRRVETVCEIMEFEPDKRIGFAATSSDPFTYQTTYALEPSGSGTRSALPKRIDNPPIG